MTRPVKHPVEVMAHCLQDAKTGLSALPLDPQSIARPHKNPQVRDGGRILREALDSTEPAFSTHPFVWPHLMVPRLRAFQEAAILLSGGATPGSRSGPAAEQLSLVRTLLRTCAAILRTWPHRGRRKARRCARRIDRLASNALTPESAAAAVEAARLLLVKLLPAIGQSGLVSHPEPTSGMVHAAMLRSGPIGFTP
ncbi:MAG TPA: hypothetical protein VMN36_15280 [Verrucomicrobiales bacterium]|nr:hypothetical protein [Verrucomicrobiales bacterium]